MKIAPIGSGASLRPVREIGSARELGSAREVGSARDIGGGEGMREVTVEGLKKQLATFEKDVRRMAEAGERYAAQTDFGFWFAVYFKTRQQCEAFLKEMGWETNPTFPEQHYVSGLKVAKKMGLQLPEAPCILDQAPKARWAALAMSPEELKKYPPKTD